MLHFFFLKRNHYCLLLNDNLLNDKVFYFFSMPFFIRCTTVNSIARMNDFAFRIRYCINSQFEKNNILPLISYGFWLRWKLQSSSIQQPAPENVTIFCSSYFTFNHSIHFIFYANVISLQLIQSFRMFICTIFRTNVSHSS